MSPELEDYNVIKRIFSKKFERILSENSDFRELIHEIFVCGSAYVVGGFIRDIIFNKRSRDIDMIINLPFDTVNNILKSSKIHYTINRLSGYKIGLKDLDVDLWCIDDNWAFKQKLVTKNDDNLLESIANGCFYNYDSLVINIHNLNMNMRHFVSFLKTKKLDIIQKNKKYKELNPTIEANILRAFYLRKIYKIEYTQNCNEYLIARIGYLNDEYYSTVSRLLEYKKKYTKYDRYLGEEDLINSIKYCFSSTQRTIEF